MTILSASITTYFVPEKNNINYETCGLQNIKRIRALKNTLTSYDYLSQQYSYVSNLDVDNKAINLVAIPSFLYGSSIKKGSVEFKFYVTGNLIAKLEDAKQNGELIETTGSNTGSIAGVILYNEGFAILTGSWNLANSHTENYRYCNGTASTDNPKWIYWGAGINQTGTLSSSFDLNFEGVQKIPTITIFAHAEKGELNHSNNLTYLKYSELNKISGSYAKDYMEDKTIEIKNIAKSQFSGSEANFEKITYISKIGIYDKDRNLIGIAKLATPVKKTENREFTFKLKLDI